MSQINLTFERGVKPGSTKEDIITTIAHLKSVLSSDDSLREYIAERFAASERMRAVAALPRKYRVMIQKGHSMRLQVQRFSGATEDDMKHARTAIQEKITELESCELIRD